MLTFLRASCVYSIHVIAIHHKTSRKLKAFCFGYSQKLQCFRLRHPMLRVHRGCGLLGTNIFLFRLSDMLPSLKLTNRPWKLMVGRLLSFWDTIFSGAMLVSGRVVCWRVYYVYIYIYMFCMRKRICIDVFGCLPNKPPSWLCSEAQWVLEIFVFWDSFFLVRWSHCVEIAGSYVWSLVDQQLGISEHHSTGRHNNV